MNSAYERSFSVWSPLRWWLGPYWPFGIQLLWIGTGVAAFGGGHPGNMLLFFPALLALYAFFMLWPSQVVVHADGVRVSWLGITHYTPFRAVVRVEAVSRKTPWLMRGKGAAESYLAVALACGEQKLVLGTGAVGKGAFGNSAAHGENGIIFRALEGALREFRKAHGGAEVLVESHLARNERTVAQWVTQLRNVTHADGYRAATISGEQLWKVLEDPGASATARAGAAVALRESLDVHGKDRLRVVAEATVAPKLRVAIEQVADAVPDEELLETLDAVRD